LRRDFTGENSFYAQLTPTALNESHRDGVALASKISLGLIRRHCPSAVFVTLNRMEQRSEQKYSWVEYCTLRHLPSSPLARASSSPSFVCSGFPHFPLPCSDRAVTMRRASSGRPALHLEEKGGEGTGSRAITISLAVECTARDVTIWYAATVCTCNDVSMLAFAFSAGSFTTSYFFLCRD